MEGIQCMKLSQQSCQKYVQCDKMVSIDCLFYIDAS